MGNNPMMKSAISGVILQALMVGIGKFVPAVATMPNFYAICGTILAAVTGAMFSRASAGVTAGKAATGGAAVGGISSVLGGLMAVASGQWPGFELVQILFPAISGGVGGALGGVLGRMMPKSSPA